MFLVYLTDRWQPTDRTNLGPSTANITSHIVKSREIVSRRTHSSGLWCNFTFKQREDRVTAVVVIYKPAYLASVGRLRILFDRIPPRFGVSGDGEDFISTESRSAVLRGKYLAVHNPLDFLCRLYFENASPLSNTLTTMILPDSLASHTRNTKA